MEWLKENLWALPLGLIGVGLVVKKFYSPIISAWRGYRAIGKAIDERQEHLIHVTELDINAYKRRCSEQDKEIGLLRQELIDEVRKGDIRDAIREQDRLMIHLLKQRMKAEHIEYGDIEETVIERWRKK